MYKETALLKETHAIPGRTCKHTEMPGLGIKPLTSLLQGICVNRLCNVFYNVLLCV